jgi:hypothetical protein
MALKQGSSRESGKKKAGSALMTGGNQQEARSRPGRAAKKRNKPSATKRTSRIAY